MIIWSLVKFFSEEKHADEFIEGKLYLNRLSYFQKMEEERKDGRSDPTEAIRMWFQPNDVEMLLSVQELNIASKITSKDLAGSIHATDGNSSFAHVFSMYAIYTSEDASINNTTNGNLQLAKQIKSKFEIDKKCFEVWPYAVFVPNAKLFIDQMQHQLNAQNYKFRAALVRYFEENLFHGEFPESDIPFMKSKRYEFQNEYRIVVSPLVLANNAITIQIGSIQNIVSKKYKSIELVNALHNVELR